ncbi:MAG: LysR family transcriptional regulator [Acidimicrobiales bacterium]
MLFRQLEYFVAVAREQHFARAAEACFVSQPALSSAIAKLEHELNVTLINRGHSFGGLTPEGERLVIWAKRILAEHDAFKAEVLAVQSGITGTLRLGTIPTASVTMWLPVAAFCSAHPLAKVQALSRLSTTELHRRLRNFEIDAAIGIFGEDDREGLETFPLYEERYVLIAPEELVPTDARRLSWTDVARLPLVLLTPDMKVRQVIDEAFSKSGLAVSPEIETDSVASMLTYVATGRWASIVPHTWLQSPSPRGTHVVTLTDPTPRTQVVVATSSASPGSPIARAFATASMGLALDAFFDQLVPIEGEDG